jgi:hypothetical protein
VAQADERFNTALVEATRFFAEDISADPDLFSEIVRRYAQVVA